MKASSAKHPTSGSGGKRFDVIVCGDGLFALWSAHLLAQAGVAVLRVHISEKGVSEVFPGLGVLWSSMPDPPTRARVAHGERLAEELLAFVREGARQLAEVFPEELATAELPILKSYRLACTSHEAKELEVASRLFSGFSPLEEADRRGGCRIWKEEGAFDLLGSASPGLSFADALSAALRAKESPQARVQGEVVLIEELVDEARVTTSDGAVYRSEFVVCGLGASSALALGRLGDVLIPVSDTISRFNLTGVSVAESVAFRASNGHVAGCLRSVSAGCEVAISGPRFALDKAGVGLHLRAHKGDASAAFSRETWQRVLADLSEGLSKVCVPATQDAGFCLAWRQALEGFQVFEWLTDAWPCDELPLLGEFGVKGRVLGSAGWLGCGHSVSLLAARIITESLLHGKPDSYSVPELFSPRRFLSN